MTDRVKNSPHVVDLATVPMNSAPRDPHADADSSPSSERRLWQIVENFDSMLARAQTLDLLKCRLLQRIANNQEKQLKADERLATVLEKLAAKR